MIGRIRAVPPKINPRLNMLEPITLPIDIFVCFVIAALMVTANSGADVPKATTVKPMTRSDTFSEWAISAAESTNQSAPFHSITMDVSNKNKSKIRGNPSMGLESHLKKKGKIRTLLGRYIVISNILILNLCGIVHILGD